MDWIKVPRDTKRKQIHDVVVCDSWPFELLGRLLQARKVAFIVNVLNLRPGEEQDRASCQACIHQMNLTYNCNVTAHPFTHNMPGNVFCSLLSSTLFPGFQRMFFIGLKGRSLNVGMLQCSSYKGCIRRNAPRQKLHCLLMFPGNDWQQRIKSTLYISLCCTFTVF